METCYYPSFCAPDRFQFAAWIVPGGSAVRGHERHKHAAIMADFFRRLRISMILSVPLVMMSPLIQMAAGYHFDFSGCNWASFALASAILWYGGLPFWRGAEHEIRRRKPGMMTLIVAASTAAYLYSTAVVFGLAAGVDFYWEMAVLIVILLWGYWLEMETLVTTSRALELMVRMLPAGTDARCGDVRNKCGMDILKC